jgi:hypothetical protein
MNPIELHAYTMDKEVKDNIPPTLGIKFVDNKYSSEDKAGIEAANEKARVLYAYNICNTKDS